MLQPDYVGRLRAPATFRAETKRLFLSRLQDQNTGVRQAAVIGLGSIGDKDVIPMLQSLALTDPVCFSGQRADDGSGDLCPVRLSARRAIATLTAR